jgi:PKD repeat protein
VSPTVVKFIGVLTLSGQFTDPGHNDTHTASINWEDATTPGLVTETNGSGSVSATHTYTATGIYTVSLTVTDDDNGADTETFAQYIVVYDPAAGFVTGGGWINSPAGAYVADASVVGKANFGFVSKYITQKDKTTPVLTGNTEFQFQAGSLNFSSTAYDWMVVSGTTKASYKGSGTVNGATGYGFLLSVVDGGSTGDKFRMKIWDKTTSAIVYDNQISAADDATASQLIAGGSIVIHTNGGLATK